MTEEKIEATIRKYIAERLDRDALSGELPQGTDEEVQQVFEVLVAGALYYLKHNAAWWYERLLTASDEDAEASIKWYVEESGKLSSQDNPQNPINNH